MSIPSPVEFCGVCYSFKGPFYLTNCAHVLCETHHLHAVNQQHQQQESSSGNSLETSPTPHNRNDDKSDNNNPVKSITQKQNQKGMTCPVCKKSNISTILVTANKDLLPAGLKSYFSPFLKDLESIYAVAKFQYEGATALIKHQHELIEKLNTKNEVYKTTWKNVREKIAQLDEYKA